MRVYELQGPGLAQLRCVDRPAPEPGPGEVLVRVRAASLNYRDLLIAEGKYGRGPLHYPLVPLSDAAGEVVAIGPGVTRVAPGDRVAGTFFQDWQEGPLDERKAATALGGAIDGVLAELVVLKESGVVQLPPSLSFEQAATLPCAGVDGVVQLDRARQARARRDGAGHGHRRSEHAGAADRQGRGGAGVRHLSLRR